MQLEASCSSFAEISQERKEDDFQFYGADRLGGTTSPWRVGEGWKLAAAVCACAASPGTLAPPNAWRATKIGADRPK